MPKQQTGVVKVGGWHRPGEGAVLELNRKVISRPDGTSGFQIGIDLGNAPVPDRRYVADAANVTYRNGYVYLIFWQRKLSGKEARSMVILAIASAAALQFLQNSADWIVKLESSSAQYQMNQMSLEEAPEEPPQAVCLAASIIAAGWSGREACLDFYYASPFMIASLAKNGKFAAEPVVRITLPTALLNLICGQMASFKSSFPKDELELLSFSAKPGEQDA